jgi:hypothetical protein
MFTHAQVHGREWGRGVRLPYIKCVSSEGRGGSNLGARGHVAERNMDAQSYFLNYDDFGMRPFPCKPCLDFIVLV